MKRLSRLQKRMADALRKRIVQRLRPHGRAELHRGTDDIDCGP